LRLHPLIAYGESSRMMGLEASDSVWGLRRGKSFWMAALSHSSWIRVETGWMGVSVCMRYIHVLV